MVSAGEIEGTNQDLIVMGIDGLSNAMSNLKKAAGSKPKVGNIITYERMFILSLQLNRFDILERYLAAVGEMIRTFDTFHHNEFQAFKRWLCGRILE